MTNLLGFHSHDFELNDDYDFALLFPLTATLSTPVAVLQDVERTRRVYALFDSFTYRFDEHHSLVAGVRGEYVRSKYGTGVSGRRMQNLGAGTNAAVDTYVGGISGNYAGTNSDFVTLPKLGYAFASGRHHGGLVYTRGYRTSGVGINRRRSTAVAYESEFTNNYELSYKYAGRGASVSANAFYIDWRDQQVQVQLTNDFYDTQVQNAARSRVFGGEVEGEAPLGERQKVRLGVGYSDTAFRSFRTNAVDYRGKQFPFASHWTGRLSHDLRLTDELRFFTVLRYVGTAYSNAENTRRSDPQFTVNVNARYAIGTTWSIDAYANNVLDREARIFDGSPTNPNSPYATSYHQTVTPREFGARLNYFW